jgi:predicted DNA-binding protein
MPASEPGLDAGTRDPWPVYDVPEHDGTFPVPSDIINIVDDTRRDKPAKRSNARSSEPRVAYPVRFPETTYDSLKAASAVTNTSVNRLVAEAVEHYLGSAKFHKRLSAARSAQEDAIRKLSGG